MRLRRGDREKRQSSLDWRRRVPSISNHGTAVSLPPSLSSQGGVSDLFAPAIGFLTAKDAKLRRQDPQDHLGVFAWRPWRFSKGVPAAAIKLRHHAPQRRRALRTRNG